MKLLPHISNNELNDVIRYILIGHIINQVTCWIHVDNTLSRGLMRNYIGRWMGGFSCKLYKVPPTIAELIAMMHGLNLCWQANHRKVNVFSDSTEAINLLLRGCQKDHPFRDVVEEAKSMLLRNWHVCLSHRPRDHNQEADQLAKYGHSLPGGLLYFEEPPDFLSTI